MASTTTKLKGQQVTLQVDGTVIASSTSCSLSMTGNTADASTKDDTNAFFASPEFTNCTWEASNESFVSTVAGYKTLVSAWLNQTAVTLTFVDSSTYGLAVSGTAYISSLSLTAAVGEYATISVSFAGDGALTF